jgi:hypothetical protein
MSREIDRRKITTYREVGLLETVARSKGEEPAGRPSKTQGRPTVQEHRVRLGLADL